MNPLTARRGRHARTCARLLAAMLPFLCACRDEAGPGGQPPVPVLVEEVGRADVPVVLTAIGSVEPLRTVTVRPQVSGLLGEVHFDEGQDVARGDLLFSIDPRPFEAALAQAQAGLARDQARAESAGAEARRYEELVARDFVTRQQYEDAVAEAEAARAIVRADEAAVERARLDLGYCSIRSPLDARTGRVLVHEGNLVAPGGGEGLVVLNQIAPIRVAFAVPEQRLAEVRQAASSSILAVQAAPPGGQPASGELTFIDNAVDESTGTVRLAATFGNLDRALWPGQFVTVTLVLATRGDAVVVPAAAIMDGQRGQFAFVLRPDGFAEMREVTTGPRHGDLFVAESGLAAGESVVVDGQLRVVPLDEGKPGPGRATRLDVKTSLDAALHPPASGGKAKAR